MKRYVLVLLSLTACKSEEERARERAADASRVCVETTRAAKLPIVERPVEEFDESWPVLRFRAHGLELDTRAALAAQPDLLPYFGKGKPPVAPQPLDTFRPLGSDWLTFPKLVAALKDYEDSLTARVRVETTLVLDIAPDVPARQVMVVMSYLKARTVLAVRDRDGELSTITIEGTQRTDIGREGCVVSQQANRPECVTPVVNLRATGAQVFAWKGLVDDECIEDPGNRIGGKAGGPFAFEGTTCELPLATTKALTTLTKTVREVAAVVPGCTHVVVNIELNARWSDVTPVLTALVATKGAPDRIAFWGRVPDAVAACPAEPLRPSSWKFERDAGR